MAGKYTYKVSTVTNPAETQLVIPSSADASPIFDCGGTIPGGLILPSTFTSSTISFSVSKYGFAGTFSTLTNFDGSAYSIAGAASKWIPLIPSLFAGVNYFILNFGTTQSSGGDIDVVLLPLWQGVHS